MAALQGQKTPELGILDHGMHGLHCFLSGAPTLLEPVLYHPNQVCEVFQATEACC